MVIAGNYKVEKGDPYPLGASRKPFGSNFALVSKHATGVNLLLFDIEKNELFAEIVLDPEIHRTGDVWHLFLEVPENKKLGYAYRIEGPSNDPQLHYYNGIKTILDPYAKGIHSSFKWGSLGCGACETYQPVGLVFPPLNFDWEDDQPLQIPTKDLIIYEMHIRSFTEHPSSQVNAPGTFLGVIEKIPHLLELGVNAVELMPIQEFNECEYRKLNPFVHEDLYQYWGYSTVNFFAPMNRYASGKEPGSVIHEFKTMVKALHKNGIAVILDIVFNHTNEGNEKGPLNSFKGIDSCLYYMLDPQGQFLNFTGCGNTVNTNHPVVQQFILDVLRYWVLEMHVDGFRFDLASIFYRDSNGEVITRSPIVEMISKDPILSKTLLISEPWDAVGLYQVGQFYPYENRWSEWNARYRDVVRRFIKGGSNLKGKFASRLSGSQDIYGAQSPTSSINFIISHDGFTLHDLVSYNQKHNLSNGENNHDGLNENDSWNCGKEGFTLDAKVIKLREQQMRNFHLSLMLSQGIPMLHMGDEYAHTKKGNNNTWCHDTELNWFLWNKLKENHAFYRFYRKLIKFRKEHSILHQGRFLTEKDVTWWDKNGQPEVWDADSNFLAFSLHGNEENELYAAFNAQNVPFQVTLPSLKENQNWAFVVNTAFEPPQDFFDEKTRPIIQENTLQMAPFSSILLEKHKK